MTHYSHAAPPARRSNVCYACVGAIAALVGTTLAMMTGAPAVSDQVPVATLAQADTLN
ncbi:hypothetical protein [Parvularcula dongshanensis]|uniref:Uncharacterized protein n=1 Tax=Parvularcula dongshanensis TaxID=1173995 RepID=A0A840I2T4_9PROT|nr:hypothetical protein [Parvularcula dongshanensis]MBB4658360.1 hypothetical protein [Parvularcula dongshanensis]